MQPPVAHHARPSHQTRSWPAPKSTLESFHGAPTLTGKPKTHRALLFSVDRLEKRFTVAEAALLDQGLAEAVASNLLKLGADGFNPLVTQAGAAGDGVVFTVKPLLALGEGWKGFEDVGLKIFQQPFKIIAIFTVATVVLDVNRVIGARNGTGHFDSPWLE